jgi:predicted phage terminase large subunit-like protein
VGLLSDKREVLYGGAAGGGKSDWLLMGALQYVDVPGYSALILRRTFPMLSLPGGLIERSKEWLMDSGAKWNEGRMRWTFRHVHPPSMLTFGHMQHENDKHNYQSAEFQYVGVDELTQFLASQYTYMFSRARRLRGSVVPIRVRAASNPGGVGHEWVKERFPIGPHSAQHPHRSFIKARVTDNPYLDVPEYVESLREHMHPYDLAQLLEGNWDARPPGSRFRREWFEIVDASPLHATRRWRGWDLAATMPKPGTDPDWTAGVRISVHEDIYYIEDVIRARTTPRGVDKLILQAAALDAPRNTRIAIEQEGGASGKIAAAHFQRLLARYGVKMVRPTGPKQVRANPLASAAEAGNVKLVRGPWNEPFLTELEMFSPECSHEDQVDGGSLAFSECAGDVSWEDLYPEPTEAAEVTAP